MLIGFHSNRQLVVSAILVGVDDFAVRFSYPVPPLRTRMESRHCSSLRMETESVWPWGKWERGGRGKEWEGGRGGRVRMTPVLVPMRRWWWERRREVTLRDDVLFCLISGL